MLLAARNILKAWLLVLALVGVFGLVGWLLDGVRGLSIFVFCALLLAAGAYWAFDRVVLGMLGARELPVGEAPLLHSTVERLAARGGMVKPRLYLVRDGLPIAAATGRGVRSSALVVSTVGTLCSLASFASATTMFLYSVGGALCTRFMSPVW